MRLTDTQLARAVAEVKEGGKLTNEALIASLLAFLSKKKLSRRAGKVAQAIERYFEEVSGTVPVMVTTVHPVTHAEKEKIERAAEKLFAPGRKKVALSYTQDKTLVGGIKLESRDVRYDMTLSRSLKKLTQSL